MKTHIMRIIQRRNELGWSQNRLAQELQLQGLDISRGGIGRIESGERRVDPEELVYFARALGVDPNWLVAWEPEQSS